MDNDCYRLVVVSPFLNDCQICHILVNRLYCTNKKDCRIMWQILINAHHLDWVPLYYQRLLFELLNFMINVHPMPLSILLSYFILFIVVFGGCYICFFFLGETTKYLYRFGHLKLPMKLYRSYKNYLLGCVWYKDKNGG